MAELMNKPVIGMVENMSYFKCPDCGKEHRIFGESKVEQEAAKFGIPVIARLPIDPEVAAKVDAGQVEYVDGTPIKAIADYIQEEL